MVLNVLPSILIFCRQCCSGVGLSKLFVNWLQAHQKTLLIKFCCVWPVHMHKLSTAENTVSKGNKNARRTITLHIQFDYFLFV